MTKSLSAYNAAAADKPYVDLVHLVQITFAGSSPAFSIHLCDRLFGSAGTECEFNGVQYDPLLIEVATMRLGGIDPIDYYTEPGEARLTIDNTAGVGGAASLTTLFATYDPHYATVIISELFNGAASPPDRMDIFKGQIEDIVSMDPVQVVLRITAYELTVNKKFSHTIVDDSTYPGADPDDLGKMVPIVYGRAQRVPAIAVDAGAKTTVIEDMSDSAPGNGDTLAVTDGSRLPSSGAFTIQIDEEQVRIASRSGNTLTLAASEARGYNDTTATAHDAGSDLSEIQTEYVYLAADHAVYSIDEVYVDGIRQDSGASPAIFTAYTGQGGDQKSGYGAKAVIVFPALPKLAKQVNAEIDSSARGAADAGHTHAASYSYLTWYFDTATNNTAGNPTGSGNLVDGAISGSSALWYNAGYTYRVTCDDSSPPSPGGTPSRYKICVAVGSNSIATISYNSIFRVNFGSPSHIFRLDFADLTAGAGTVFQSGWYTCSTSEDSWAELGALDAVAYWETGTGQLRINEVYIYVEYYTTAPDGYAAVSLSGSSFLIGNTTAETVIGRRITADIKGVIDDGSIIGSPAGQLIERPDYILQHLWINYCGLTSGEIDSTSYDAAGSFYSTNSYRLAFAILQRPNILNLVNRIARQSGAIQFWEAGQHYLTRIMPDQIDSYTKLLLHMDGSDGSTTFTDDGTTGHTVSANGDAQIDTAQQKFGGSAGLFDGTGDYLSIPDHADWAFGSSEFTVDFWIRFSALSNDQPIFIQYVDADNYLYFLANESLGSITYFVFVQYISGVEEISVSLDVPNLTTNTWYHIALIRGWGGDGDTYALTINGQMVDTVSDSTAHADVAASLFIGYDPLFTNYLSGWIDEFRISNGIARWTANFTPPTMAYPVIEYTADHNIEANHIDLDQIHIGYTPRARIDNNLTARYDHHWDGSGNIEDDRAIVIAVNAASVTKYGTLRREENFPYIIDSAMAQDVLDWILDDWADPRLVVEFSGGWALTDIERGDIITFTAGAGDDYGYLQAALLGLVSFDTDFFRVLDMQRRSDNAIQITAVEI